MLRATGVHARVIGTPPRGPCFLVSNHLGYLDVFVIAAQTDCVFVSMKELVHWPLIGPMARQIGTIFIDRSRKRELPAVNAEIDRAFEAGHVIVIFPEGRHSPGDVLLPFRPALLEPAARGDRKVAWATVHYTTTPGDPPASRVIPWIDRPILRHALVLLALDPIHATITFGDGVVTGTDRKELAEELRQRVLTSFRPLA